MSAFELPMTNIGFMRRDSASTDLDEFDSKRQGKARQRMVRINCDRLFGDLSNHQVHFLSATRGMKLSNAVQVDGWWWRARLRQLRIVSSYLEI